MIKLFEYKIHTDTDEPIPLCWKVFVILFAAFMMLVMAVVCASCQPDNMENEETESRPAILHLKVTGEEQVDVATRAVSEDAIHDLHILIYDSEGELIGQQYAESSTVTINTHSAGNCTIYAIANTGKKDLFNSYDIHTETALKELTCSISTWDELTGGTHLPMTGSIDKVKIEAGTQTLSGGIKVSRMAAKITLNVKANSGITINSYCIYDIPLRSYYILRPLDSETNEKDHSAGDDAATPDINAHWTNCGVVNTGNVTTISKTFYMYENRRGVVDDIDEQKQKSETKAPAKATYIEIKGKVNTDTADATWRIYLGANNTNNFNIKRNGNYTYNITLNDGVIADTRVEFEFKNVEDLSASGTSNCYLAAKTNTWYKFRATIRGNGAKTSAEISPTGTELAQNASIAPQSAQLVWETGGYKQIIQGIVLQNGYVYFKTGPTAEGNAVIAVKDAASKVLWSWHIWKTSFDLTQMNSSYTQTYRTNPRIMDNSKYKNGLSSKNLTMMDRNLGAADNRPSNTDDVTKTYGLYYQFGRKDPFPMAKNRETRYASQSNFIDIYIEGKGLVTSTNLNTYITYASSNLSIAQSIMYAIQNPLIFICNNPTDGYSFNWIYGATVNTDQWKASNKLWGSELNNNTTSLRLDNTFIGKTIHDPCPAGWCVPPQEAWTNFTTNTTLENDGDYNVNGCLPTENGLNKDEYVKYFNCPADDKKLYLESEGYGFMNAPVFGRRFYISATTCETAFYPASGFRRGEDGKIWAVGNNCNTWSSAPFEAGSSQGGVFFTNTYWVYPIFSSNRANGVPIRCVKEADLK